MDIMRKDDKDTCVVSAIDKKDEAQEQPNLFPVFVGSILKGNFKDNGVSLCLFMTGWKKFVKGPILKG